MYLYPQWHTTKIWPDIFTSKYVQAAHLMTKPHALHYKDTYTSIKVLWNQ